MKNQIEQTVVEVEVYEAGDNTGVGAMLLAGYQSPHKGSIDGNGQLFLGKLRFEKHDLGQAEFRISYLTPDKGNTLYPPERLAQHTVMVTVEIKKWIEERLKSRAVVHDGHYGTTFEFNIGSQQFTELAADFILECFDKFGLERVILEKKLKIYRVTLVRYKSIGYMTFAHDLLFKRGIIKFPFITHPTAKLV